MDVKQIKAFISAQGVQVSTHRKPELIKLAKAVPFVHLPTDSDFESESIDECLLRNLALPARQKIFDPFQMASLSGDSSQLPPVGMMDIFNQLLLSLTDYDKSMLSSWRSFEEYDLCMNGHVQSLGVNGIKGLDGSIFSVFVAGVIPTQKEKTQSLQALDCCGLNWVCVFCRCRGAAAQ